MPKLSIITVNFNNAVGLRKTIESVVCQTSMEFEYIVIDGESTDGSIQVIEEYVDKLSYWISEPDSGIYNAMNKGIRQAKGEYCQFLNSGDWLAAPDVTERMLKDLPDCSILNGALQKTKDNKDIRVESELKKEITFLDLFLGSINHSSAYIKRDLFDKYGYYDETLKIVSDWKFFLETIVVYNESVVSKNICVAFFDVSGISHTNNKLDKEERERVLKDFIPPAVLKDYYKYGLDIKIISKLKKFWIAWFFIRLLYKSTIYFNKLKFALIK